MHSSKSAPQCPTCVQRAPKSAIPSPFQKRLMMRRTCLIPFNPRSRRSSHGSPNMNFHNAARSQKLPLHIHNTIRLCPSRLLRLPHPIRILERSPLDATPTIFIAVLRELREAVSFDIVAMHKMLLIAAHTPRSASAERHIACNRTPQTPAITPSVLLSTPSRHRHTRLQSA